MMQWQNGFLGVSKAVSIFRSLLAFEKIKHVLDRFNEPFFLFV